MITNKQSTDRFVRQRDLVPLNRLSESLCTVVGVGGQVTGNRQLSRTKTTPSGGKTSKWIATPVTIP